MKRPLISIRDINTLQSTVEVDKSIIVPDLSLLSGTSVELSDDFVLEKEDQMKREAEVEKSLKFQVADVVKKCLNKFYKTKVPVPINSKEEFEFLASQFSSQFKNEIVEAYLACHQSIEGLVLTSDDKRSIVDQIMFYFQVRKSVSDHLSRHTPNPIEYLDRLTNDTSQFYAELRDSYRSLTGTLIGIKVTADSDLWIRNKIEFVRYKSNS